MDAFINLRELPNSKHETRLELCTGEVKKLAPLIAIDAEFFEAQPFHEQMRLRVVAQGRSAYRSALVGKSAARVYGLWVVASQDEVVELTTPSGYLPGGTRDLPGVKYRKMHLERVVEIEGVRVCSAARAAIDIARFYGMRDGVVAMDSYLNRGGEKEYLRTLIRVMGRVKGVANARKAIELAREGSESPYESAARVMLAEEGMNAQLQAWVGTAFRVDLLIDGWLIVEIDGEVKYGESPDVVIRAERKRQKYLENRGFRVLRFTPREVWRDEGFIEVVKRELAAPPRMMPHVA